ncbi:MAG: hypothetical protein JSS79_18245 [Bacteroidetes bacterium]|nr:hypothetical protein [Bacteroidota bacterium]
MLRKQQPLKSARILLGIFLLSVSFVHLITLGHSLLHRVNNPLHYHSTHDSRSFKSHSLADHHFPKMKFAYEMNEPSPGPNFIAIAFGLCQPLAEYSFKNSFQSLTPCTEVVEHSYFVYSAPPTPPPSVLFS